MPAACESFMSTLKREEIHAHTYRDLEDLRGKVQDFIARYYNTQRLHSALGYRSPEEFEAEQRVQGCPCSCTAAHSGAVEFFRLPWVGRETA